MQVFTLCDHDHPSWDQMEVAWSRHEAYMTIQGEERIGKITMRAPNRIVAECICAGGLSEVGLESW